MQCGEFWERESPELSGGQRRGTEWAEEDAPFGWEWSVELQRNDQETLSGSLGTKRKPGFCWREVERLRASSGHP